MADSSKSYIPPEEVSLINFDNIITKSENKKVILIKCDNIKDLEGVSIKKLIPIGKQSGSEIFFKLFLDENKLGELKEMVLISKETGNTKNAISAFYEYHKAISNNQQFILQSIQKGASVAANVEYQKREQPAGMKIQYEPLGSNTSGKSLKEAIKRYEVKKHDNSPKVESKKRKASIGNPEPGSASSAKDSSASKKSKKK